jgi:CHAD domain-containing protein
VARTRPARAVPPAALVRELDRVYRNVDTAIDAVIDRPHPSAGALHRLHRELRRLRTGLTLWARLLARRDRERLAPLDGRLKRLARLVGRIRDRDIAIDLLAHVDGTSWGPEEAERLARYRTRLRDDARTGRELLRAFLRAERDAGLLPQVRAQWTRPDLAFRSADVRAVIVRAKGRGEARVREAHRDARHKPSTRRLHRLRIRVRGLRHLGELAGTVDPVDARPLSAPLRRLQVELGRLHDLDVVIDHLAPEVEGTAWAEALRDERRRRRDAVLAALAGKGGTLWAAARARSKATGV